MGYGKSAIRNGKIWAINCSIGVGNVKNLASPRVSIIIGATNLRVAWLIKIIRGTNEIRKIINVKIIEWCRKTKRWKWTANWKSWRQN